MEAMTTNERKRIIELYERGWPTQRIAEAMGRSPSGVRRIRQRCRERGQIQPLKRGSGRPLKMTASYQERLAALAEEQPDATLDELRAQLGLDVSRSTIDRHLRALKLSFKKKSFTPRNRIGPTSRRSVPPGL